MAAKGSLVTHRLLGSFFDNVETLPAYLERILPDAAKPHLDQVFVPPSTATSSLATALERLQCSLVGSRSQVHSNGSQVGSRWSIPTPHDVHMGGSLSELIQQAQMRLFRGGAGVRAPSTMLTLGYREADDRLAGLREVRMLGSMAITNFYVNSHVSAIVLGLEWQHLLEQLGPGIILHLFTEISLFQPVSGDRGNLMQILGATLADMSELTANSKNGESKSRHTGIKRKRTRYKVAKEKRIQLPLSQPGGPKARVQTLLDRSKSDSVLAFPTKSKALCPPSKLFKPPPKQRKATEIQLVRNRIFYARPVRARSGKVAAGLPIVHIFNRSTPKEVLLKREKRKASPWIGKTSFTSFKVDAKTREARSRKVLKYIWPKEHGLHNVLTGKLNRSKTSEKWQEYTNREEAITSRGAMRTPKRLQTASRLISILLAKHDRLDYAKMLHYCCPSSLPSSRLTAAERQVIAVDLSETEHEMGSSATQVYTQPSHTAMRGTAANSFSASQGQSSSRTPRKPAFTKYKVATGSVSRFAQAVVRQVFPIELLGSQHNLRILLKNIDTFIRLRRHETLTLHHLCQGFQLLDCHWLLPRNKRSLYQRPTASEMQKRQSLLYEFLYYVFDSFLIPLLRTNFYATESAAFRNRTVYFRQDDWNSITLPILEKLKEGCFTTISKNEAVGIMSGRQFGYSYVRLLPKLNGVRPIINLRRRSIKIDRNSSDSGNQTVHQQQSINNILNVTFHVLKYEKRCNVESMGSSVFGAQDIYDRLQIYKKGLLQKHEGVLPSLYLVKADVVCAFDSIDQEKLLEIVQDIICHDRYVIQRFCQIMTKGNHAAKTWPRLACAEEDQESFSTTMQEHSKDCTNAIFSDGVVYSHCERSKLIWLLEEHINNNLIKVGKDFCKQRVGIPQGSSLSTLLCCYYLARMEKRRSLHSRDDRESLLMRYTDDFLFVSTSQEKATAFYETIQSGDELFNVKVSMEKSLHNLEVGVGDERSRLLAPQGSNTISTNLMFPWCSYLLNVKTLSIQYDMNRYFNTSLSDTLTIHHKRPISSLSKVMQSSIRNRNLPIFLDVDLNGLQIVVANLYRNFLLTALKFVSCYRQIRRIHQVKQRKDAYIIKVIMDSIHVCFASAQAKMKRSTSESAAPWPIDRFTFYYLALHAFARIFSQRPSCKNWARPLQKQLRSSTRYQKAHHRHHQHVIDAWESCKSVIASITV